MKLAQTFRLAAFAAFLGAAVSTGALAQTLTIGVRAGPESIDPHFTATGTHAEALKQVFDTLIWSGDKLQLEPRLATSWKAVAPDVWEFKLRPGVKFHDGSDFTAEDVKFSIERIPTVAGPNPTTIYVRRVKEVKIVDPLTVQVVTDGPAPNLPNDFIRLFVVSHKAAAGLTKDNANEAFNSGKAAIGTGPYKLAASEAGVRYNATRFEDYWDRENAGFAEQVEVVVINDATARIAALQGGQVHMINRIEPKTVSLLKNMPRVTIRNISGRGFYPFNMFCDTAPFDNKDLRLALKYAMDRETMIERILRGYGSVGNDTPINKAYPLYEKIEQRAYDPEKAAFHFKKSGHDGAVLLRTSEVAFPGAVDAAVLYQESAKKAGIAIEVKREPGDGYWSNVWNVQPFSTSYWGGRPTQDQMYSTGYISSADWNDTRFKNEAFDKMVVAARAELDETKRRAMYRDMSEMMRDEGGLIAPMFNDFIDGVSANIQGWVDNPAGELMNGDAPLRCWLSA